MSLRERSRALRCALALLACALSIVLAAPAAAQQYAPEDDFTANWTRADALKVRLDPTNTKPRIPADFPVMTQEVWVWDTWPLTRLDTTPVSYRGWHVIFSLVAPRNIGFDARHEVATIGYFFSRDGRSWEYGGEVFPGDTARGARQWAGSAVLVGDQVQMFYTASGNNEDPQVPDPNWDLNANQRIARATARIRVDANGPYFAGQNFRNSTIVAEADGRYYQTEAQGRYRQPGGAPNLMAFRDPFVFRDPADDQVYMLFEGNIAGENPVAGTKTCGPREVGPVPPGHVVPPNANLYEGAVGLARAANAAMTRWELLPPLLSAVCVNAQTERPHLVIEDGRYYLMTISHTFTYAPGLTGPDGVYGFLGDSLRSDYEPLNASALVLGNPPDQPFQAYSEYVMPNWLVEAFIDRVPLPGGGERSGGTLAPTLRLEVDGSNTYVVEQLDYGFIPAMANAGGSLSAAARR
jgi:levansucrase